MPRGNSTRQRPRCAAIVIITPMAKFHDPPRPSCRVATCSRSDTRIVEDQREVVWDLIDYSAHQGSVASCSSVGRGSLIAVTAKSAPASGVAVEDLDRAGSKRRMGTAPTTRAHGVPSDKERPLARHRHGRGRWPTTRQSPRESRAVPCSCQDALLRRWLWEHLLGLSDVLIWNRLSRPASHRSRVVLRGDQVAG